MPFRERYQVIRDKLDKFGFFQPLSVESLSLVSSLLTELQSKKEALEHFQNVARLNQDGNSDVETELVALRLENRSLMKEKEHLKKKIDNIREEDGKIRKELRLQVIELENRVSDLEFVNTEQLIRIQELEGEVLKYSSKYTSDLRDLKNIRNPSGSESKKVPSSELPSAFSVHKINASQEISGLRRDKETLQNALADYECQVTDQNEKIKTLLDELKQLRSHKSYQKKPCSCHDKDRHVAFEECCNHKSRTGNCNCCPSSDDSSPKGICTKCMQQIKKPPNSQNKVADLESCINELMGKLESEKTSKDKLVKSVSLLKEDKNRLIEKLENAAKAELEIVQQLNNLFKENVSLRGELAAIEESKKSIKRNANVKNTLQSKPGAVNVQKPANIVKSKTEEKESNTVKDIENIVKDEVENCMKNMKVSLQSNAENVDQSRHQFMNTLLQERDHFYCQYQKLRNKIGSITKSMKNIPTFECPLASLDQIAYILCNYEKRINELTNNPITNQVQKPQCSCAYTDLSSVIKSYEIKLKELETRENEASTLKEVLTMKLHSAQEENIRFKSRVDAVTKENSNWKSKFDQMCLTLEEVERSLRNSEDNRKISEAELECALSKIKKLECQKTKLEANEVSLKFEKNSWKKNLIQMDQQKDLLTMKLDEKTERVVALEGELKSKKSKIVELEESLNKVEHAMRTLQKMHSHSEISNKMVEKSTHKMKTELQDLRSQKETLSKENRRLQDDLSAALRDCVTTNHELAAAKLEIDELKEKLQSYVSEVRRIEDLLQSKEDERRILLNQLKNMNADSLSANSKSLDRSCTVSMPADAVSDLQDRLLTYEAEVLDKNNMLVRMEEEVDNLKLQVQNLESELAQSYPFPSTANNFQDDETIRRLEAERAQLFQLRESVTEMRKENCRLQENLQEVHFSSSLMEDTLSRTKRETVEEAAKNKSLSVQVRKLEQMILQLKEQLESAKSDFSMPIEKLREKKNQKKKQPVPKNDRTW